MRRFCGLACLVLMILAVPVSHWVSAAPKKPKPEKIQVCHKGKVIEVSDRAVKTFLRRGGCTSFERVGKKGCVCIRLTIDEFTPDEGAAGDIITIRGSGFGNDPDDLCVVAMMGPERRCSLPMQVLDVNEDGTEIQVQVGPVFAGAQPGPIMVARGEGAFGTFEPFFEDVVVEEPVWIWERAPRFGAAAETDDFFFPDPPPREQWIHGEPNDDGTICVILSEPWGPNQKFSMVVRLHDHDQGIGHDGYFPCIRIRGPGGSVEECAARICDVIRCAFLQQSGGIEINCDWTIQADGNVKLTIGLPNGSVDWGNVDICLLDTAIQIDDFTPQTGATGDVITITGSGFDPDPDNNCAVVMMGGCSLPLQVIQVNEDGTEMQVVVGPVWQGARPGPIMVATGEGAFGTFDPVDPTVVVEAPVWIWDRNPPNGPAADTGELAFTPVPPPEEQWIHGEPNEEGTICVFLSPNLRWAPNQKLSMVVRLHDHQQGIGHDGFFPCMRLRVPDGGSNVRCAKAICDMIKCAYFQQAGIVIDCTVNLEEDGTAKITVSLPNGFVNWGNVDICLIDTPGS